MEVKNASDVKSSRLQRKRALRFKKKKESMEQEIENGNAESKEEKGTCLEAENVRSDLGAEQSSVSRKKRKKMNGNNSLDDEKKTDSFLKEEANSLTDTLGNAGSEPGPKEGPAGSETKRKRRKKKKKAQTNAESVLELKDKQENPLIDKNKVSDSHLEISKNLGILENVPELTDTLGNAGSEPGPKEGPAGSETKRKRKKKKAQTNAESVLELKNKQENPLIDQNKVSDSHLEISKNLGILENVPGLVGDQLNESLGNAGSEPGRKEGPAGSETKRKRRKKKKKAQTNAESVLELKDKQENPLIDKNKVSDSHLEISKNLGILENVPELTDTLGNAGSEPGPKEGPAGSETKRKRKKKKAQTNAESVLELKNKQENPLIDQNKVSDSHLEISKNLGILENVPGLVGDQLNESLGNAGSEPGRKEGPAGSETKRKRRKKKKKAQTNAESVLELKDKQENPLIDQNKVSDSHLEISKNLGILENVPELTDTLGNAGSEPGPKEGPAGSETKRKRKKKKAQTNAESVLELKDKQENPLIDQNKVSDSHLEISKNLGILEIVPELTDTLGNAGSEPGPKEGPAGSETKRKRKKKKAQTNAESVLELKDKQENPLIDQHKVSDSHLEISKNLGILENVPELTDTLGNAGSEPGPKEGQAGSEMKRKRKKKKAQTNAESVLELKNKQENPLIDQNKVSDSHLEISKNLGILENVPGLVGDQLNESETKRKKKKRKRNKTKIGAIEDEDTSSKNNVKDINNEAGNKKLSISEAVESKQTNSTGTESDLKGRKEKKSNELVVQRNCISLPTPEKKLLVLDLNGILVDVVQGAKKLKVKPRIIVNGKGVFKRPFCAEFLDFCFKTFDVGIWSSRVSKNVNSVVNCIMGKQLKSKLLFCWCRKKCTITKFKTLENEEKPLVLKELKKLWDKHIPGLPWKMGKYNESNTILLDDSPYKALRNPANTAIFPHAYQYTDAKDCSLAIGGDIREYLERLAAAENVQKFVEQNPFGQPAITEAHPRWDFYSQI